MDNTEHICRVCLLQPKIDTLMATDSEFCSNIQQCTGVLVRITEELFLVAFVNVCNCLLVNTKCASA